MIISEQELASRLENFKKVSRQHKLPITPQKLAIFRTLAASCSHPSAQTIHNRVKEVFSNISLATVYKNLKRFIALDLIAEIPVPGEPTRYDAKLETHGHVVDTTLGQVYDLELSPGFNLSEKIMGKEIKRTQVTYYL